MAYTAFSPKGPRIALAVSEDLIHWQRLGLATFRPYKGIKFDGVDNKDASVFPVAISDPAGQPAMAILHRPLFPGTLPEETARHPRSRVVDLHRESIWISYCPLATKNRGLYHLCHFALHRRLASPVAPWEQERQGTVANVVFPTGIDRRDDLGTPDRFDVYYGMADDRIGVARLEVPEFLPPGAPADMSQAKGSHPIDDPSQT